MSLLWPCAALARQPLGCSLPSPWWLRILLIRQRVALRSSPSECVAGIPPAPLQPPRAKPSAGLTAAAATVSAKDARAIRIAVARRGWTGRERWLDDIECGT